MPFEAPIRRLCGLRPTGRLHIGHYFANILPTRAGADLLIASFHAPAETFDVMPVLHDFGVANERLLLQEKAFNAILYFRLLNLAHMGELERMTQFKSADMPTPHLLVYPVLMAHDVAGYDEVIVGEDQVQHLEYCRTLLQRHNRQYGWKPRVPTTVASAGRIMSLTHPERKMSKSEPSGCLFLDDNVETLARKVKRAVTTPEGRNNLVELYRKLGGVQPIPEMNEALKALLLDELKRVVVNHK